MRDRLRNRRREERREGTREGKRERRRERRRVGMGERIDRIKERKNRVTDTHGRADRQTDKWTDGRTEKHKKVHAE
jgi:hypothetical protein